MITHTYVCIITCILRIRHHSIVFMLFCNCGNIAEGLRKCRMMVVVFSCLMPIHLDNDGIYEDANGNGRLDFDDIVAYYQNMGWIEANTACRHRTGTTSTTTDGSTSTTWCSSMTRCSRSERDLISSRYHTLFFHRAWTVQNRINNAISMVACKYLPCA